MAASRLVKIKTNFCHKENMDTLLKVGQQEGEMLSGTFFNNSRCLDVIAIVAGFLWPIDQGFARGSSSLVLVILFHHSTDPYGLFFSPPASPRSQTCSGRSFGFAGCYDHLWPPLTIEWTCREVRYWGQQFPVLSLTGTWSTFVFFLFSQSHLYSIHAAYLEEGRLSQETESWGGWPTKDVFIKANWQ